MNYMMLFNIFAYGIMMASLAYKIYDNYQIMLNTPIVEVVPEPKNCTFSYVNKYAITPNIVQIENHAVNFTDSLNFTCNRNKTDDSVKTAVVEFFVEIEPPYGYETVVYAEPKNDEVMWFKLQCNGTEKAEEKNFVFLEGQKIVSTTCFDSQLTIEEYKKVPNSLAMVQWTRLLCVIAYGIMLANVGMKIYEKYKPSEPEVPPKPKPDFLMGKTKNGSECKVYVNFYNISNNKYLMLYEARLEDMVAHLETFVHRQLHDKSSEIECFYRVGTDEYKLTKYTRSDLSANEIGTKYFFDRRQKVENDQCYKIELHIVLKNAVEIGKGLVHISGWKHCVEKNPKPKPQPVAVHQEKPVPAFRPSDYLPRELVNMPQWYKYLMISLLVILSILVVNLVYTTRKQRMINKLKKAAQSIKAKESDQSAKSASLVEATSTEGETANETTQTEPAASTKATPSQEETKQQEPTVENQIPGFVDNSPKCPLCFTAFKTPDEVQTHWNKCLSDLFAYKKEEVPEGLQHMYT